MSKVDWSKAPEWATCVVILKCNNKNNGNFYWSENPYNNARIMSVEYGTPGRMNDSEEWEVICYRGETPPQFNDDRLANDLRPVTPTVVEHKLIMTPKAGSCTYEQFIANGWDDDQLVESGYATRINDESEGDAIITGREPMSPADLHLAHLFTPAKQPSTAPDLLQQATQLLAERGQQYDNSGNERSAAKIVAAFNIITGRDLTPGEGWLFQILLKAVRFYSNTETPHRDSLEDMIAYAALHAEEYLNDN